jgi:hypothetical protein
MPRYYFDIKGFHHERDDDGVICADLQAAVREAKKLLPIIASDEVPQDGEHHAMTVLITDEDGHPVYSGALSYVGTWLIR